MNIRVEGGHKLAVFLFDIPEICAWTNTQDLAGLLIVHGILFHLWYKMLLKILYPILGGKKI